MNTVFVRSKHYYRFTWQGSSRVSFGTLWTKAGKQKYYHEKSGIARSLQCTHIFVGYSCSLFMYASRDKYWILQSWKNVFKLCAHAWNSIISNTYWAIYLHCARFFIGMILICHEINDQKFSKYKYRTTFWNICTCIAVVLCPFHVCACAYAQLNWKVHVPALFCEAEINNKHEAYISPKWFDGNMKKNKHILTTLDLCQQTTGRKNN